MTFGSLLLTLGGPGGALGAIWGDLGGLWGDLGGLWGDLGGLWGGLWGDFGSLWGDLGELWGDSRDPLGRLWWLLGRPWGSLGRPFWGFVWVEGCLWGPWGFMTAPGTWKKVTSRDHMFYYRKTSLFWVWLEPQWLRCDPFSSPSGLEAPFFEAQRLRESRFRTVFEAQRLRGGRFRGPVAPKWARWRQVAPQGSPEAKIPRKKPSAPTP